MSTKVRLSEAQKKVVSNLLAGKPAGCHLKGQAQHGGFNGTFMWLLRHGYADLDGEKNLRLTDKGRALAESCE